MTKTLIETYKLGGLSRFEMFELAEELFEAAGDAEVTNEIPEAYRISDSFREELRRRAADCDANPDDGTPSEEVHRRLRERYGL